MLTFVSLLINFSDPLGGIYGNTYNNFFIGFCILHILVTKCWEWNVNEEAIFRYSEV